MDDQQQQQPAASNGEAMWDDGAEEVTPSVAVARAGVRRRNTTGPVRRSMRRRGDISTPGCSTAPAAFNVAGGTNSIDLPPKDAPRGEGKQTGRHYDLSHSREQQPGFDSRVSASQPR